MLSKLAVTVVVALISSSSLHVVAAGKNCSGGQLLYCCPNTTPITNPCVTSNGKMCVGGKFQCCTKDSQGGGPKLDTCANPK